MTSRLPHQAYAAAMRTVASTRQVVMLYDAILRQLQLARDAMEKGHIETRYRHLSRASEIIFGLQSALDYEKGGNIAHVLYGFYASLDLRIFSLHRTNSVQECDTISSDVRQMREAWETIDKDAVTSQPALPPQAEASVNNQDSGGSIAFSA